MLFIIGMAFVLIGLWEELAIYMNSVNEEPDVIYYIILTLLKFIGSFFVLIFFITYLY